MSTEETKPMEPNRENVNIGRVKWFNNKIGYGFITSSDGIDVFVHHSAIKVNQEQYRYLVEGEYVEFTTCILEKVKHKYQAGDVKGISNGKLMCETRQEARESRVTHTKTDKEESNLHKERKYTENKQRFASKETLRSRKVE